MMYLRVPRCGTMQSNVQWAVLSCNSVEVLQCTTSSGSTSMQDKQPARSRQSELWEEIILMKVWRKTTDSQHCAGYEKDCIWRGGEIWESSTKVATVAKGRYWCIWRITGAGGIIVGVKKGTTGLLQTCHLQRNILLEKGQTDTRYIQRNHHLFRRKQSQQWWMKDQFIPILPSK